MITIRSKIQSSHERGAALIPVVLLIGLLSLLVTSLSVYVTNSATSLSITRDRITQSALIQSALEFGMGRVLSTPKAIPIEGEDRIRLQTGEAHLQWRGENARLDINVVDETLLASLLETIGLSAIKAKQLTNLIIVRRSGDINKPLPREYLGLANKKRGPFAHIRELLDLPGMTTQIFYQLAPLITVYSGSSAIDPRLADRRLIEAIPDMSRPLVAEILSLRGMKDDDAKSKLSALGDRARFFDLTRRATTRFTIETRSAHSTIRRYEIVTIHFPDDTRPYRILSWQEITEAIVPSRP